MARALRDIKHGILSDLRQQFASPTKSFFGFVLTKYWEKKNHKLIERVVEKLNITPDSKVLELGFGRGYGLKLCHAITRRGKGHTFGIEASDYMIKRAHNEYVVEFTEGQTISIETVPILHNLPYPNDFFDAIYHIDAFYFWTPKRMRETCNELFRILKPTGTLLCGMELQRLKRFERFGILNSRQYDPMKYMMYLEPAGFENVKIEYEKLGSNREIQLINAQKPQSKDDSVAYDDAMRSLELNIKRQMAFQSLTESQIYNPELVREAGRANTPFQHFKSEPTPKPSNIAPPHYSPERVIKDKHNLEKLIKKAKVRQ